jgi:hypothetical protein
MATALQVAVVVAGLLVAISLGKQIPEPCQRAPTSWIPGVVGGDVRLVALMNASWALSHWQSIQIRTLLKSFEPVNMNGISAVIINSADGEPSLDYLSQSADDIPILQDNENFSLWQHLNGKTDDILIFDRCHRLAFYLPYPLSLLNQPYVRSAILATYFESPCGACDSLLPQQETSNNTIEQKVELVTRCEEILDNPSSQLWHVDVHQVAEPSSAENEISSEEIRNDEVPTTTTESTTESIVDKSGEEIESSTIEPVDNAQSSKIQNRTEFENIICQIPQLSEALEQLTLWYHKRSFFQKDSNQIHIEDGSSTTTEESFNVTDTDMLTSCPDYNRIRCADIESKILRSRHCCHIISKVQLNGTVEYIPRKCINLTAEKCTKLRGIQKCCREDNSKRNQPEEPRPELWHEFSKKEVWQSAERVGFTHMSDCSDKKPTIVNKWQLLQNLLDNSTNVGQDVLTLWTDAYDKIWSQSINNSKTWLLKHSEWPKSWINLIESWFKNLNGSSWQNTVNSWLQKQTDWPESWQSIVNSWLQKQTDWPGSWQSIVNSWLQKQISTDWPESWQATVNSWFQKQTDW